MYAEVVVDVPAAAVDRIFHYAIPVQFADLAVGARVRVPFGRRQVGGFVLALTATAAVAPDKIKAITAIEPTPPLPTELITLARWLAEYYNCLLIEALTTLLPPWSRGEREQTIALVTVAAGIDPEAELEKLTRRAPKQAAAFSYLLETGTAQPVRTVALAAETEPATVMALVRKGLLELSHCRKQRRPPVEIKQTPIPELTTPQAQAVATIDAAVTAASPQVFLLHGVTASGKTEVYLRVIATALAQGRGAIVLVPEIALTPQMVERFCSRFGDAVAILHSNLGTGERYDEWQRVYRGEARIVVGARSAVFAPVPNLGLIIIDEEHEPSYKQEVAPRYHAREVALARAANAGAPVVLGSATPSIESYWHAQAGHYQLLQLPGRVGNAPLPPIKLVDMRRQIRSGNRGIFSPALLTAIKQRLEQGEQTILFLNRRGYTTVVLCRECGYVEECPHCAIPLTFHRETHNLRCHYCQYQHLVPSICPNCGSPYLRHFGLGTERVEQAVRAYFPTARVLRMDMDTTRRKGAHGQILAAFRDGKADILIGTQMIAKGLDFPRVTLVGVIAADLSLRVADFRAAERCFQLLTQVAGRAGRGPLGGEVFIQTYMPDHYSIQASMHHDYLAFYTQELKYRARQGYPPFRELVNLTISGEEAHVVANVARDLAQAVRTAASPQLQIYGPGPAPIARIRNQYRFRIALKAKDLALIRPALTTALANTPWPRGVVTVVVDVQPISML